MNKIITGLVLLLVAVSLSCKRKPIVGTYTKTTEDSISLSELRKFSTKEFLPDYFQFKCKVDFAGQKMNENFTINGRLKRDSIIWMSITPGLGIEVARCLIRKDSIFILDRINNGLSAYSFDFINQSFQTQLSYSNLEALVLGNLPYKKEMTDKLFNQESEGFYLLRQKRGEQKVDNYILNSFLRVGNLEVLNKIDKSTLSVKYENFAQLDSVMFANNVKAVAKMKDSTGTERTTTIDLQFTKTEISIKPLNFPFNVPRRFENK
jgi:hypothetical protein